MFSHLQIGQGVVLILDKDFAKSTSSYLQPDNPKASNIIAKIVSIEAGGIWIEKPNCKAHDPKSNELKDFVAHIYVPAHFIVSAVVFPECSYTDVSMLDANKIGFV